MTVMAVAEPGSPAPADEEIVAGLWSMIEPESLTLLGWDPDNRTLCFPVDHPQLGWRSCLVEGCIRRSTCRHHLCNGCAKRWRRSALSLEDYVRSAVPGFQTRERTSCVVAGCARPWGVGKQRPLCTAHHYQRTRIWQLPLDRFLEQPDVVGLAGFGRCAVLACVRDRPGRGPYCAAHQARLKEARRQGRVDEDLWRRTARAIVETAEVSLRGLPDRIVAEVIYGLQQRTKDSVKTRPNQIRPFCDLLRRLQLASVEDLTIEHCPSHYQRALRSSLIKHCQRSRLSPETEWRKDEWNALAFGHAGWIRFGGIEQPWLREAAKRWAYDDLPRRRGSKVADTIQSRVKAIERLSESLRLQRDDAGRHPGALGRADILAFLNRLAYLEMHDKLSRKGRILVITYLRPALGRMRALGLTRPGQPLHGLPDDFAIDAGDVPDSPEENDAGKDLPVDIMRQLHAHLPQLEASSTREARVAVELLMETGRRPDEICQLPWDCLEQDGDGKPVLNYDNHKALRRDRRLPITAGTAALIVDQQERVRARFADMPTKRLKLFPTTRSNPHGNRAISANQVGTNHLRWVKTLPDMLVPTVVRRDGQPVTVMRPFDTARIFLYAYRHTYAQRHADAGVPVDVLCQLMQHRQLSTTQKYYRVGEERRREAVERVTTMQFDRHGNRLWRQAKTLLDSEHTRRAVGEVAVPYGGCTEPSNVAAGGQDCPVRFRCIGCGHFSTDISYLPDLERYLADLLRHRERLRATLDADEWAKTEAMPSDNEITRIRRLIARMKGDLDDLSDEDRAHIDEAVAVVRRSRTRIVGLGIPRIRQPLPDIRPERSA